MANAWLPLDGSFAIFFRENDRPLGNQAAPQETEDGPGVRAARKKFAPRPFDVLDKSADLEGGRKRRESSSSTRRDSSYPYKVGITVGYIGGCSREPARRGRGKWTSQRMPRKGGERIKKKKKGETTGFYRRECSRGAILRPVVGNDNWHTKGIAPFAGGIVAGHYPGREGIFLLPAR